MAAILFGALILAGREIQPSGVPAMIQGIILFALIVADALVRYRVRLERRASREPAATAGAPPAGRLMDLTTILAAGVASGTVLLFAAVGEIFAERAGVLNLGVEGMMLMGAVAGFSTSLSTGNPWLGVLVADRRWAGRAPPRRHHDHPAGRPGRQRPRPDVPRDRSRPGPRRGPDEPPNVELPRPRSPSCRTSLWPAGSSSPSRASSSTSGSSSFRSPGSGSSGRGQASTFGPSAGIPAAADAQGIGVYRLRYAYVVLGGVLAGLAGAAITLAISPGWFGDQTVNGRGWIAVGLVIFARWNPIRAALGAYLFAAIFRLIIDVQGSRRSRRREPVPSRTVRDVLPGDAAVPLRRRGRDPRRADRDAPADRRAGGARNPVRPRRARGVRGNH